MVRVAKIHVCEPFRSCEGVFDESGEPVEISVTDQGVGMNPHQLAAVLGREKSVSTAGTAGEKGSGLGLAICREMLKSQGGDLLVTSKPGKGSTFTIRLPR